jgi:nitric oxide reductase activation protein
MARNAALMIGSALDEMSVPYAVRGFGADGGKLLIADFVLKDFGRPLDLDVFARHNSGQYGENRDSDSLRRAVEVIKGESGKKIIFLISDGQPSHPDGVSDYRAFNKQCDMDMIHAIRDAEDMDISVIGVGITSSAADFIKMAYSKGFYIQKLDELPEKLIDIYLKETETLRANLFHKLH